MLFMQKRKHHPPRETVFMQWTRPASNCFELNIDGSAIGNPGIAGWGGLMGDANGNWVPGFTRYIDHTTSSVAELWAIGDGLNLVKDLHITHLEAESESDAPVTVPTLLLNFSNNLIFASLLNDRRTLLEALKRVKIRHACREGNRCADKLARRGRMLKEPCLCILFEPPPDAMFLSNLDKAGNSISTVQGFKLNIRMLKELYLLKNIFQKRHIFRKRTESETL